jgi:hypothetical protein
MRRAGWYLTGWILVVGNQDYSMTRKQGLIMAVGWFMLIAALMLRETEKYELRFLLLGGALGIFLIMLTVDHRSKR